MDRPFIAFIKTMQGSQDTHDVERNALEHNRRLLMLVVALTAAISVLFYWIPQDAYNHQVNLMLALGLLSLLPFIRSARDFRWVVHVMLGMMLASIFYFASQTGGIHSTVIGWLMVAFVAALLFLGPIVTSLWIAVVMAGQVGLWWAAHWGWISASVSSDSSGVLWTLSNQVGALVCLLLGVWLFDRKHEGRVQEVKQRNEELMRLHVSLQGAQVQKDEFVAAVGHELRTPMNAILGLNNVLRDEYSDQPEVLETVDHIRRSTQHLLDLINDILDYSQLQAGKVTFTPQPCHVPTWFGALNAKYAQRAQELGLSWQVDIRPMVVRVDAFRLTQVVAQLLNNAFKFTKVGQIRIKADYQSYFLRIEVEDSGKGIPAHRQKDVFNRFEHADQQTNRAYGGAGLGLAICERLVTLQRGRIGVVSQEGQGSMFWIELPCELLEGDGQTPALSRLRQLPDQPRVLVVDDNPVNVLVAKLQLASVQPDVTIDTAASGREALEWLKKYHYHLALVDMVMPDMDGVALTQQIRSMAETWSTMPIVALTAHQNPEDVQRCLDAGMNAVLHKPLDEAVLKHTLTQWLATASTGASQ